MINKFATPLLLVVTGVISTTPAWAIPVDFLQLVRPLDAVLPLENPMIRYTFGEQNRQWTDKEKKVVLEAAREWDALICNKTNFVENRLEYDLLFRWGVEKDFESRDNPATYLYGPHPQDPTRLLKEVVFNPRMTWYIDDDPKTDEKFEGYDLLTVAKHEIGHALGIEGDWGSDGSAPPGKHEDEVMWYDLPEGVRKHPKPSDIEELAKLGYHVTPEPPALATISLGLGTVALFMRTRQARSPRR